MQASTDAKDWVVANQKAAAEQLNKSQFNGKAQAESEKYIDHFVNELLPKVKPGWKVERDGLDRMIKIGEQLGLLKAGQVTFDELVPEFARA